MLYLIDVFIFLLDSRRLSEEFSEVQRWCRSERYSKWGWWKAKYILCRKSYAFLPPLLKILYKSMLPFILSHYYTINYPIIIAFC